MEYSKNNLYVQRLGLNNNGELYTTIQPLPTNVLTAGYWCFLPTTRAFAFTARQPAIDVTLRAELDRNSAAPIELIWPLEHDANSRQPFDWSFLLRRGHLGLHFESNLQERRAMVGVSRRKSVDNGPTRCRSEWRASHTTVTRLSRLKVGSQS